MALRLAGEEFSVVQGLDSLGWLRDIEANDASPGLDIAQSGSGPALKLTGGDLEMATAVKRITWPGATLGRVWNGGSQELGIDAVVNIPIVINGALKGMVYSDRFELGVRLTTWSGRLMLGNPGASGHALGLNDVHAVGVLEVDGLSYLDGGIELSNARLQGIKTVATAPVLGDLVDGEVVLYDDAGGADRLYCRVGGVLRYAALT